MFLALSEKGRMLTSLPSHVAFNCLVSLASLVPFPLRDGCSEEHGAHILQKDAFPCMVRWDLCRELCSSFLVSTRDKWCWFAPWQRISTYITLLTWSLRFLHCEIAAVLFYLVIVFGGHPFRFYTAILTTTEKSCLQPSLLCQLLVLTF